MPHLLPESLSFYQPTWIGPGGRLVWAMLFTTIGLLWIMLLMKQRAFKSPKLGPAIAVTGFIAGAGMVVVGNIARKTPLVKDTLVPNGYLIAWIAVFSGLWIAIMAIRFEKITLPFTRLQHLVGTLAACVALYVLGGFVHAITIATTWLILLVAVVSISLFIWSLPRREHEAGWAGAIFGALASFVMMTMIYAIIPHEWINFATSYLSFTKDAKVSTGGQFVLNTWLDGHFWTKRTRLLPFEVTYEMLQDQATMAIYVIGAIFNIKLFAAWQKRNDAEEVEEATSEDQAPAKTSRFGRPLRKTRVGA